MRNAATDQTLWEVTLKSGRKVQGTEQELNTKFPGANWKRVARPVQRAQANRSTTVFETCKAVIYNQQLLQQAAAQLVRGRVPNPTMHYQLIGTIQITVRSVSMQNGMPTLTTTLRGTFVSQIYVRHVQSLVAGKPRLKAIQVLSRLAGVQTVSITGIADNQQLPTDVGHIHLNIYYLV